MEIGYKPIKILGSGSFGVVELCRNNNGQLVCVKKIAIGNKSYLDSVKREIYILSQVKHPRIIRFIDAFSTNQHINIIMEYAPKGTLRDYLAQQVSYCSLETVMKIFLDILMGLEYLHIRSVIHRDLKPDNILIGQYGRMKIADFGISFIHTKSISAMTKAGTPFYIAPEVFKGLKYDFKADIWSLGCIFYELCTLRNPFAYIKSQMELYEAICNPREEYFPCQKIKFNRNIQLLCENMLVYNPARRLAIPNIISNRLLLLSFYNLYFEYY